MANTTIQLKYSTTTATPTSLNVAEPAYSYSSNTLFIGSPAGTGSIAIGGKFYLDQQALIFTKTNVAFDAANSAGSYANAAFAAANTAALSTGAYAQANAAFITANAAFLQANASFTVANAAFTSTNGTIAWATANSAGSYANSAYAQANTATNNALAGSTAANAAFATANSAASYANSGFAVANAASSYANSAFIRANNSINANTGGTITADLVITGNLTVQGNTTYVDTRTITSGDSLIHLANNNTVGDTVDIGFYGSYNSSGVKYTGLVRQAGANYFLFKDITSDPTANVLAPGSLTAANTGTLTANLTAYSVTINGQDINQFATNAYTQANTAVANALAASTAANAAFAVANTASASGTSAGSYANSAFATANSAGSYANSGFAVANSAASYANSAFAAANNSSGVNLTQNASITAAFTQANAAFLVANGAAFVANTDYTNLTITAGNYGTASAVASFKVEANGRISSANNTSIAIDASAITSGTLPVGRGGSGAATFTNNGVLLGQGTSAFATASSSTEGHVLTINSSGVPTFAMISGGTF
jgi:hypothetical protein